MSLEFDPIDEVLESLRQGHPIIVTDDANRENEGDLILAAEKTTAETLSFMIRYTSGVICVPMEGSDLDRLELPLMTLRNNEAMRTAYTISVDAKSGVTTGISAADRTRTIRLLSDPATRADDLVRPGHVFPLRYREGGVLRRAGHTEAAVDLARLAGLRPAGVLADRSAGRRAGLPADHPNRRRGHAGRCVHAEQLFRVGGLRHRLHHPEPRADHHRRTRRRQRRDPVVHHVQGHEPQHHQRAAWRLRR